MAESAPARDEFVKTCSRAAHALDHGNLGKARRLYEKALDLEDGTTTDDERLIVRESLAECCYGTGRFEAAETFFRDALALSTDKIAAYGPQHEVSIALRNNLARGLSEADSRHPNKVAKLEEAISLYRQNADILDTRGGHENQLSHSRSSLAFCLGELAKQSRDESASKLLRAEAVEIYSNLLQAMKVANGSSDVDRMIEVRHNYASVLYDMKRYQDAKEEFLRNEKALKDLPVEQKDNLEVVVQQTDSYLEACSEATNDLQLSLQRRTADPLDRHKKRKPREILQDPPRPPAECGSSAALIPVSHRPRAKSTLEVPSSSHLRRPKSEEPLSTKTDRDGQASRPKSASDASSATGESRARGRSISPGPRSSTIGELFENEFKSGHHADEWFLKLHNLTHSLLDVTTDRRRIRVAILDSGVSRPFNVKHQRADIRRIRARLKEYQGMSTSQDWVDHRSTMHGTNCASLLLQVAPQVDLYISNVTDADGRPTVDLVSGGLAWALEPQRRIDIISMSLGFNEVHDEISDLVDIARQKKALVFASSSNDGDFTQGTFPAMLPTVFDIRSTTGLGGQAESNQRLTDEKVNFMFLGQDIAIAGLPGSPRLSGNSYATPIAAGTAALVLDLAGIANKVNATSDMNEATAPRKSKDTSPANELNGPNAHRKTNPRVGILLRKYEGMSAVFKEMSGKPGPGRYHYNVHPWTLLQKYDRDPFSRASDEWQTYVRVCDELRKAQFGTIWGHH